MNKTSRTRLAHEHLLAADSVSSDRNSRTVYVGREHVLRQALIALASGQSLEGHANPGKATVHVLHGRVGLTLGGHAWDGSP
jgi:quercetin dioxygenase-like cupin family protein